MGKKKAQKFYLAHPFDSREYVREWASKLEREINIKIINPFYPKRVYENFRKKDVSGNKYYQNLDETKIVKEDLKLINKSNGLIGIVDGSTSYGTIMEMAYTKYLFNKPVYLIITNNQHNDPWLKYNSNEIFTGFEEFEEWAGEKLVKEKTCGVGSRQFDLKVYEKSISEKIKEFYLDHSFESKEYKDWSEKLERKTNIKIINTFDSSKNLDNPMMVEGELKLVEKSDGFIGIIDGSAPYGTIQKMVYAYLNKKPIYSIITNNHHNHPWLKYHSDKGFTSFKKFEKWAKKNL